MLWNWKDSTTGKKRKQAQSDLKVEKGIIMKQRKNTLGKGKNKKGRGIEIGMWYWKALA